METVSLPLSGVRVLEFTHAIMGPMCGLVLADLGAEVIKIEPAPEGDPTRRLKGYGVGFFTFFNRNKRSVIVDAKTEQGKAILEKLLATADVVVENFAPTTMERLGLGYRTLSEKYPELIYCSLKGFLPGPYELRPALDEVIQMMAGLAYMTGPEGQPLRAGTSILDIMGGTYGALGVILALHERKRTGYGQHVMNGLFETASFLMGQHMAQAAISQEPVLPMPGRVSAWAIYRLFKTCEGDFVFIAITSDRHWERFCRAFTRDDLLQHERIRTNNDRVTAHDWLIPELERMFSSLTKIQIMRLCEEAEIPFAPVGHAEDLFDDPHLLAGGSLLPIRLQDGNETRLPAIPLKLGNHVWDLRLQAPLPGEHTRSILNDAGYAPLQIEQLYALGVIQ